jgi:putative ABC transport system substrate-binding protein
VAKRLELLREVVPTTARVCALWNADNATKVLEFREAQEVAAALGLQLVSVEVRRADAFDDAFQAIAASEAGSLVVFAEPLTNAHSTRIAAFALQQQLPSIYELREFTDAGGLMNYGPNLADLFRRAAVYVDRILKGAQPADLPVEQPTKFDFVINLRTARALGLTIPPHVLAQATEVIH